MSEALINGLPVIGARLQLPRFGNWTADVVVDVATAHQVATGAAATLSTAGGALTYVGTVYRSDVYAEMVTLKVVGGPNGLANLCRPRFYNGVPVSTPLADLAKDARHVLSSTCDENALGIQLAMWTMISQEIGMALGSLAMAAPDGSVWRILPDGTIFFGVDSFSASSLSDYDLIDYMPQENVQVIAAEVPTVSPGQSFGGKNVSAVEHTITDAGSRSRIWFE